MLEGELNAKCAHFCKTRMEIDVFNGALINKSLGSLHKSRTSDLVRSTISSSLQDYLNVMTSNGGSRQRLNDAAAKTQAVVQVTGGPWNTTDQQRKAPQQCVGLLVFGSGIR